MSIGSFCFFLPVTNKIIGLFLISIIRNNKILYIIIYEYTPLAEISNFKRGGIGEKYVTPFEFMSRLYLALTGDSGGFSRTSRFPETRG